MCNYINLKASDWFDNYYPYELKTASTNKEIAEIASTAIIEAASKHYILYDTLAYLCEWKAILRKVYKQT
jgi:hypothetical protein